MASGLALVLLALFALCALPAAFAKRPESCDLGCISDSECGSHGTCQNLTCVCSPSWDYKGDNCSCDYHRRSRKKAFLLSFFLGAYGADRFYLYYGGIGAIKLVLGLLPCCLCIPICLLSSTKNPLGIVLRIVNAIIGLAIFGWWLADVIRVGTGSLKDAHDHKTWDNL